ncbi:hypothetical protein Tco_0432325 [Tanacetum coccineum]
MASASSSEQQPKKLTPASNVNFECEDGIINFNNGIALLECKNSLLHLMLQFLSNSCVSAALTKQPSAYYSKYLREFWYTAEEDSITNTITFTLSKFDKPLSFNLDEFSTVVDLKPSENCVSLPPQETVKAGLATLELIDANDTSISSSDLANSESSSTLQVTDTQPAKEIVATTNATQGIDAFVLAKDQGNQPQIPDATKGQRMVTLNFITKSPFSTNTFMHVHEPIVEKAEHVAEEEDHDMGTDFGIVSMGDARLEDMYVDDEESPFDTKSEIKVVKRMQPPNTDDEDQITFLGPVNMDTDLSIVQEDADLEKLDYDLVSMLEDDIESVADYDTNDNIDTGTNVSADKIANSDPFGHLREELCSLTNKNCSRTKELVDMIRDMVHLLNSASVFCKANTEGEKWEKANPDPDTTDPTQGEQQPKGDEMANVQENGHSYKN